MSATPTITVTFTISDTFTASPTLTPDYSSSVAIRGVYPNPVGAKGAVLLLNATFPGTFRLRVYDLRGELVWDKMGSKTLNQGDNRVVWMPLNNAGNPLAYGAYYMDLFVQGDGRSAKAGRWITVLK